MTPPHAANPTTPTSSSSPIKFFTAAKLVTLLEVAQQQHRLDRLLATLDYFDLLAVDELGYVSFSRAGAELLFQVFADRYERRSLLITSNLPFGEWGQLFQGERIWKKYRKRGFSVLC